MPVDKLTKSECCGCNACGDVCPVNAITFSADKEGFWYPKVNYDTCIKCELCTKICPEINIATLKHNDFPQPPSAIAAINKNMAVRWDSTSGGAFSAFADKIYEEKGYVGGAVYTEDFHVVNFISNNPNDLPRLRSSKYLESYAEGLYKDIKQLLDRGERVMVCGTPCQMAALRSYLRKPYDNLLVIDFICRGVNSPKVYRKYLDSLEYKYKSKVSSVKAKNKEIGWRNLTRKVTFENGKSYYGVLMEDDFRRGYHTNVYCRPSCYQCVFKGFPRMADITLGDFWGVEKHAPNLDNNIGTSLILLNSGKGVSFWETVKDKFEYKILPFETAIDGNVALFKSIGAPTIDRDAFFDALDKGSFDEIVAKFFPLKEQNASKFKQLVILMRELYRTLGPNPKSLWRFWKINHRKNTLADFAKRNVLIPYSGTVLDIDDSAVIELDAPLWLGVRPIRKLKIPGCLKMGRNTRLIMKGGPRDRYGKAMSPYLLKNGCYIEILNGGTLTLHSGAANVGLTIMCCHHISIGRGVRIGRNVSIRDWNGPHVIVSEGYRNGAPVKIGNRVWLGSGCSIMPGVTVGEGSVVGANSVVTRDVPPRSLVVGSPAKVVKSDIEWY